MDAINTDFLSTNYANYAKNFGANSTDRTNKKDVCKGCLVTFLSITSFSPCQTVALPIPFAKARPLIEIVKHQAIPAEDRKGISSHDAC